jgi:DNA gyrase subunit A
MAKKHKPEAFSYAFDIFEMDNTESSASKAVMNKARPGAATQKDALELAQENYKNYSIYVAQGRAYPNIKDGAKSVYKRAIYGMWKDAPRTKVKVAELAAYALPYHPHPTSISGVIVSLGENGNKLKFLETQGNFGDSSKGVQASADRYIEGKLSDLAINLLCDGVEYCSSVKGELDYPEPEALPSLLPFCFINGQAGIPAGLPKLNIPSLDIEGMFDYYLDILKHKDLNYTPKKLPIPNVGVPILSAKKDWEYVLKTGKGTIRLAPEMTIDKNGTIVITAMPASKTAEHVRKIIEKEILLDKIDMRDESTYDTRIVIEKVFKKQCDMQELFDRLYKKLQTSESYNLAFFDQDHIYVPCSFDLVVKSNLNYLIETHTNRLAHQIQDNQEKLEVLQIIEKLKKTNNWKAIFDLTYDDACSFLQTTFNCSITTSQAVLRKPISYLTKEHQQEITDLQNIIGELENDQSDIFEMLAKKYKAIKQKVLKETTPNTTKFI